MMWLSSLPHQAPLNVVTPSSAAVWWVQVPRPEDAGFLTDMPVHTPCHEQNSRPCHSCRTHSDQCFLACFLRTASPTAGGLGRG